MSTASTVMATAWDARRSIHDVAIRYGLHAESSRHIRSVAFFLVGHLRFGDRGAFYDACLCRPSSSSQAPTMSDRSSQDVPSLDVLLVEHTSLRENARHHWGIVAALTTVGVAVLGGLLALAAQPTCRSPMGSGCPPIKIWGLAPLVPMSVTALLIQMVAMHQVSGTYASNIERAILAHPSAWERPSTKDRAATLPPDLMIKAPALGPAIGVLFDPRRARGRGISHWVTIGPIMFLSVIDYVSLMALNIGASVVAYNKAYGWDLRGELTILYLLPLTLLTMAGVYVVVFPKDLSRRCLEAVVADSCDNQNS